MTGSGIPGSYDEFSALQWSAFHRDDGARTGIGALRR
jgi:hypothetical protein